jgi:hypothetical protein
MSKNRFYLHQNIEKKYLKKYRIGKFDFFNLNVNK